ncbi:Scr1 family TA system antitoxin-like transcriptional regulator [Streptomyces sp. NPDC088727]|uniref:Scr1 family TA system antitoxin-like transcriptional regulator n=1 Tax=Streptomyces sp. NPDC088727 TaxID=3365875 RepID=UPI003825D19E
MRRPVADSKAWDEQLARLVDMSEVASVALQVLPFAVGAHHPNPVASADRST